MTSATPERPSSTPPDWPHCGHGATAEDPVGCRGIHVPDHTACLAHLSDTGRDAYLADLVPGADIDHRGTPFTLELLNRLLDGLHDPTTSRARIGLARFDGASFTGLARFDGASFTGLARFDGASFATTEFRGASFADGVWFDGASFTGTAYFEGASFTGPARFTGVSFTLRTGFDVARFDGASFTTARFDAASFTGSVHFDGAQFEATPLLGPLMCGQRVVLDGAVFQQPVTVEVAARQVSCRRTRWASTATLRLRYADLELSDAVFEYPVVVTTHGGFPLPEDSPLEALLSGREPDVRLRSMEGVDAAYLALQDIDLSNSQFAGAIHLDQLRVDGWCTFATTPPRWSLLPPWRWSPRNTLAEEHYWRVRTARRYTHLNGWTPPPHGAPRLKPAALAALYRQVRKSLEDGKNEPGAADFYYGEMEMRRHDATRPRGERALITLYWAVSGYGLRATRALAWLGAAMAVTVAVMVLWGLPTDDPKPTTTGRQVPVGQQVAWTTDTPDPVNPTGPLTGRVTGERVEKALRVVINSVVFRSSGQDLTTTGTYTEMASRLVEPILLGLAVLAVRSRVKR